MAEQTPHQITDKLGELLIDDVLKRNGFQPSTAKRELSPDQKEQIKSVIESLRVEAQKFFQSSEKTVRTDESYEHLRT